DGAQRRAQIVGNRVGECFQFCVGLLALLNAEFKLVRVMLDGIEQAFSLRHVTCNFGESVECAFVIAHSRDYDVGPKTRAILAHAPPLACKMPFCSGGMEYLFGKIVGAVFWRVERGKMFADDLLGLISLDALGSEIP